MMYPTPHRLRDACTLAVCLALCVMPPARAGLLLEGRYIDMDPSGPYAPSSKAECEAFRDEVNATLDAINKAHDECLNQKGNEGSGYSSGLFSTDKVDNCSKAACQELHTSRATLRTSLDKRFSACMAEVNASQISHRHALLYGTDADSITDWASFGRKLASSPISQVKSLVQQKFKEAVKESISISLGGLAPTANRLVNAGEISRKLLERSQQIRAACTEAGRRVVTQACDEVMLKSVRGLADMVPGKVKTDPLIATLQTTMLQQLYGIQDQAMQEFGQAAQDMDDIGNDSPSQPAPAPRAGHRRPARGFIENE